jgi:hypothetical protein
LSPRGVMDLSDEASPPPEKIAKHVPVRQRAAP